MDHFQFPSVINYEKQSKTFETFPIMRLPVDTLLNVFAHLSKDERIKVSGVCKKWRNLVFSTSKLWRTIQLTLRCSAQSRISRKAYMFIRKMGHHLRKLSIKCEHVPYHDCKFMAICFRKVLMSFTRQPDLKTFKVTDLRISNSKQKVISQTAAVMTKMFLTVKHLTKFEMSSTHWPVVEGTRTLDVVLQTSKHTLETLKIDGFFETGAILDSDKIGSSLASLRCLTKLSIDYFYLNDSAIIALSEVRTGQIRKLKLVARDFTTRSPFISARSWKLLTQSCPSMKVEVAVTGFVESPAHSVTQLLDPSLRIYKLKLVLGDVFTDMVLPARSSVVSILEHIADSFKETLIHFELDVRNHEESIEDAHNGLIRMCRRLDSFKTTAYITLPHTNNRALAQTRATRKKEENHSMSSQPSEQKDPIEDFEVVTEIRIDEATTIRLTTTT